MCLGGHITFWADRQYFWVLLAQVHTCINRVDTWADMGGWVDGRTGGWADGRMGGRMGGHMGGHMGECMGGR